MAVPPSYRSFVATSFHEAGLVLAEKDVSNAFPGRVSEAQRMRLYELRNRLHDPRKPGKILASDSGFHHHPEMGAFHDQKSVCGFIVNPEIDRFCLEGSWPGFHGRLSGSLCEERNRKK